MGKIHKHPVTSPGTERVNASVPCTVAPSPQTPPSRPALLPFVDLALQNCVLACGDWTVAHRPVTVNLRQVPAAGQLLVCTQLRRPN